MRWVSAVAYPLKDDAGRVREFIVEHDKEYGPLNQPYEGVEPGGHRYRLHHPCDLGFTFYEEIYKHHVRYRLPDTEDRDEWQQNMAHVFSKPYVRGCWPISAGRYARSFQAFANDLLAKTQITTPESSPRRSPRRYHAPGISL